MIDADLLTDATRALERFFGEQASLAGLVLNPTRRGERDTWLAGRMYEEEKGGRLFVVVASNDPHALAGFVKRTGLEYELELLCVMANVSRGRVSEHDLPQIWRAYESWLHQRADGDDVVRVIETAHG